MHLVACKMALGFLVGAYHPVVTLRYFFHLKKKQKLIICSTQMQIQILTRGILFMLKKKKKKSKTWQEGTSDRVELVYMRLSLSCTI